MHFVFLGSDFNHETDHQFNLSSDFSASVSLTSDHSFHRFRLDSDSYHTDHSFLHSPTSDRSAASPVSSFSLSPASAQSCEMSEDCGYWYTSPPPPPSQSHQPTPIKLECSDQFGFDCNLYEIGQTTFSSTSNLQFNGQFDCL